MKLLVALALCATASAFSPALSTARTTVRMGAAVGDKVPSVDLDYLFPPTKVNMGTRLAGKKTIIVGLPGAFTPTWSTQQVPGYLEKQDALKAKGIDEVLVYCVNDGAVMEAWAKDQGVAGSMVTFLADTRAELTKELGVVLDHPGPMSVLGNKRSKRFAIYADDGVIKHFAVSEAEDDPAGDADPSASCVDAMLEAI